MRLGARSEAGRKGGMTMGKGSEAVARKDAPIPAPAERPGAAEDARAQVEAYQDAEREKARELARRAEADRLAIRTSIS